jgi:hypothetical protein
MTAQITEEEVIQTCEVHGFPLDPDQLEVVTAVVNQILLSASKPAAKSCQTGWDDICHMAKHDGVVCPDESCDIDDGIRAAPSPAQGDDWIVNSFHGYLQYREGIKPLPDGVKLYARAALQAAPAVDAPALTELKNIAEAKRFNRDHFDDDTAFADWVQSRARHILAAQPANGDSDGRQT